MRHNATFARDYTRFKRTPFVFKTDLDNFSTITFTRSSSRNKTILLLFISPRLRAFENKFLG